MDQRSSADTRLGTNKNMTDNLDLGTVRHDIDAIDDQLLNLLTRRFELTAKVRQAKLAADPNDIMPLRPAREAIILRRLVDQYDPVVPLPLLVKLWRSIICYSTLSQSNVQINLTKSILDCQPALEALSAHFIDFPLKPYTKLKMALNAASKSGDQLCAVIADEKWVDHVITPEMEKFSVILTIPFEQDSTQRHIIILADLPDEPTGQDETLVVTKGKLPREFVPAPMWEVKTADGHCLTSLPGFLDASESPLIGLSAGNPKLALKVLGRYPSPFEG